MFRGLEAKITQLTSLSDPSICKAKCSELAYLQTCKGSTRVYFEKNGEAPRLNFGPQIALRNFLTNKLR